MSTSVLDGLLERLIGARIWGRAALGESAAFVEVTTITVGADAEHALDEIAAR